MIVVLAVTLAATIALSALAYGFGVLLGRAGSRARAMRAARHAVRPSRTGGRSRRSSPTCAGWARRFHTLDPRTSFAKVEAVRGAYDRTLAECCTALGITHLLAVLAGRRRSSTPSGSGWRSSSPGAACGSPTPPERPDAQTRR